MKSHKLFFQRGVTLFELLLVLFVAAFVAVAVATIYNRVNTTYKTNALFNDVQQFAANTRSLYGSTGNYTGLTNQVAMDAGIVPTGMNNGGLSIHSFSSVTGSWTISPATGSTSEFTIKVDKLPSAVCVDLASKAIGVAKAVTAGTTAVTTVSTAITGCGTSGTNSSVSLTFN